MSKLSRFLALLSIVALISMAIAVYQTVSEVGYPVIPTNELPRFEIWIIFMDFNPNERTVTYRLQIQLWTTGNVSHVELTTSSFFATILCSDS